MVVVAANASTVYYNELATLLLIPGAASCRARRGLGWGGMDVWRKEGTG